MAPMEQQPAIACLLLQLDLLVEPRKMSIYREEAIEALIDALRKQDFPNSQSMALDALISVSGRLTASGKPCTEAWLLKVAGFDQRYNSLEKAEKLTIHETELTETLEAEENATSSWEKRVAFVLCNHEKGSIFKALGECLKSNSIEMAKSCLVAATWLIHMLYNLPDTGIRDAARKSLLDQFIYVLQSSKNLEEKILATLALRGFITDPGISPNKSATKSCLQVWDAAKRNSRLIQEVHDVKEAVHELTANGNVVCFSSQGTGVKVYNWTGVPKHINFNRNVKCLAMTGDKLYCGCTGFSIQEVDLLKYTSTTFYSGPRKLLGKQTILSLCIHKGLLFAGGSSVDGTAGKVFSLSSKAVIGSLPTGFDIHCIAVNNEFIFTATKCGIIEVWLKERVARVASIKMGGGGHSKITSLTSDTNGDMFFAGSSEGKIQNLQLSANFHQGPGEEVTDDPSWLQQICALSISTFSRYLKGTSHARLPRKKANKRKNHSYIEITMYHINPSKLTLLVRQQKAYRPTGKKSPAMHHLRLLSSCLVILAALQGIHAVEYVVTNTATGTPGGVRFDREIGIEYTKKIMGIINRFVWELLDERTAADRKPVEVVNLYIVEFNGAEAITWGDNINVSSIYLQGYQGNLTWEFTSLLYHEVTHVFQWNGEGQAPVGLVEGFADYTILKANYYPPAFAKPGQGDRWDQGYDFTARFLEYCEGLRSGFVAELNKKMRHAFNESYFEDLLGKPVDQLWKEYKAKYSNN
ncbi:hypothetical protein RJ639_043412 [Escallonia herrerae]|uniref:Putative E3 ubiquitin-protein ligase LIN ARM-like domain-containing protein n=1 Tax=Escallonia herrerae TaxID=1293975 RepID=A0AA88WA23_9ASTE|nr:hypothetical protein RJ639_043412 [Escallonia herrerae]